ncbi:MAG TPA: chromate efflux transporter [Actinomycetota bacterium]|nr:chromate efflux transporter [Actinomycetota bacterium]
MATAEDRDAHPERGSLGEVAGLFLKLGTIAFGGPAAHIALMHTEVVGRRRWVSEQEFLDLVGATNLLPGPSSTELAIYLGLRRAGWRGLVAAGACFIAPAFAIVLGLAVLYDRYGTTPVATDLLYGVTPVVIAIVVHALVLLGRTALKSAWLAGIGLAALGGYLAGLHPLPLLALGAALWLAVTGGRRFAARFGAPAVLAPAALAGPWLLPAPAAAPGSVSLATLFWTFLKLGSVVFGSGYVLLAFLRDDLVEGLRVLSDQQLVDAVAVGQVTPGPVFTTATFIGYLVAGTPGAVVATLGMFAPSFVLVPLIDRLLTAIRRRPWVRTALDGVNVVAVALMAGVAAQLARTSLVDPLTVALAAATLVALLRWRPNPTWLIAAGAAAGLLHGWA